MLSRRLRFLLLGGLSLWALSHADVGLAQQLEIKSSESPAEKCRRVLGESTTLDWRGGSLQDALHHLEKKTGLVFRLDGSAAHPAIALPGMFSPDGEQISITLQGRQEKLRVILNRFLRNHGLAYAVMADHVLVTSEDRAFSRQLQQRVDVEAKNRPARTALADLGRRTGINVVFDPAAAKLVAGSVDLHVEDVAAETALRLLAELAGARAERLGDVLFVTTADKADGIRRAEASRRQDYQDGPVRNFPPGVIGGFGGMGVPPGVPPPLPPDLPVPPMVDPAVPPAPPVPAPPGAVPGAPPPDLSLPR